MRQASLRQSGERVGDSMEDKGKDKGQAKLETQWETKCGTQTERKWETKLAPQWGTTGRQNQGQSWNKVWIKMRDRVGNTVEDKARDKPGHRVRDKTSEMSMCISTAQARTNYAPRGSQGLALRHFHRKFSRQHSLLRCPCACRPHRLAQSLRRAVLKPLVCGIFIGKCCVRGFSAPRGSEALGLRHFYWKMLHIIRGLLWRSCWRPP